MHGIASTYDRRSMSRSFAILANMTAALSLNSYKRLSSGEFFASHPTEDIALMRRVSKATKFLFSASVWPMGLANKKIQPS